MGHKCNEAMRGFAEYLISVGDFIQVLLSAKQNAVAKPTMKTCEYHKYEFPVIFTLQLLSNLKGKNGALLDLNHT